MKNYKSGTFLGYALIISLALFIGVFSLAASVQALTLDFSPSLSVTASPTSVLPTGSSVITWSTTNSSGISYCYANSAPSGVSSGWPPPNIPGAMAARIAFSGTQTRTVSFSASATSGSRTFTITCVPLNGSSNLVKSATVNVVASPTNGGWSDWGACSGTCGTTGTQTRTCTNPAPSGGGAACVGGTSKFCTNAPCVVSTEPTISTVTFTGTTWTAGTEKTLNINFANLGGGVTTVVTSICHPSTGTCGAFGALDALGLSGNGAVNITRKIGALVYSKITSGDTTITPYYNGYQAKLKVCPATSAGVVPTGAVCAFSPVFTVANPTVVPPPPPPATTTPPATGAMVDKISLDGVIDNTANIATNNWPAGGSKNLNWHYWNFGSSIKTVSFSLCHPLTIKTSGEQCTTFTTATGVVLNKVTSGSGSDNGTASYSGLQMGPKARTNTFLAPYLNNYQSVVKICPTDSNGVNVGTYANCSYSGVFTITDPNDSHSSTYDLPSGQGCFTGECVCVNGYKMKCGNPMLPYSGCTGTVSCPVPPTSLADKLIASVSGISSWFLGIIGFNK